MLTFLFYFVLLFLSPVLCNIEYLFSIFNKLYYYYYYYYYLLNKIDKILLMDKIMLRIKKVKIMGISTIF